MEASPKIEQLEIALLILKSQADGSPLQFEVNDTILHPDEYVAQSLAGDPMSFLLPSGRYIIRIRDPWKKEREAYQKGSPIEFRFKKGEQWFPWSLCTATPKWDDPDCEYRIADYELVDFQPMDIEIGSVLRHPSWVCRGTWAAPAQVYSNGVVLLTVKGDRPMKVSFAELRRDKWMIQRPSKPGLWEYCDRRKKLVVTEA